ncbi:MAG TPA: hypothetical protein VH740_02880 [Vicinamibacterales bacterium]|jgi:hypothetical protein
MNNRRRFAPRVAVPLFIAFMGLAAFSNMASSPRFATFQTIDVVRLMASGVCLGASLAALLIFFGGPRSG